MGTVVALWRYPVKSMLGESLTSARVAARGLAGDRAFAALDRTGAVGSAKHPRAWGPLLRCRGRIDHGGTVVELPDGTILRAGSADLDRALSALLDRPVRLTDEPPPRARLDREVPEYDGGVPDALRPTAVVDGTGATVTAGHVAAGTFFDFGAVHLVTTATLARLRAAHPAGDFDARRFRPNLVVDAAGEGFVEDTWAGRPLRVGAALLRVVVPTPRCVIPTLAHDELPADPAIMRTVAREHRVDVLTLGRLACVGAYLDVLEPGPVHIGDPVHPTFT